MSEPVNAALVRKLSAGQKDLDDRPRSVLRALRLGFARAAGDRLNLPLAVIGARQTSQSAEHLVEAIGQDWLLLVFDGPQGRAATCLDPHLVSAIVQTQTIGEVMSDAPTPRAFTDTDAAMVAPLVEAALARSAGLIDPTTEQVCLEGNEYSSRAADLQSLSLTMTEDEYRIFDLTVDLANGVRQGQISVILPEAPVAPEAVEETPSPAGPRIEQSSGMVRADLNAALCRMTLPLSALSGMQVGDVLPLRGARLDRTEVLTIERTRAGVGRLGQCGGLRAIRLNEHAALPALSGAEAQEFIESRAGLNLQGSLDAPIDSAVEIMPPVPLAETGGILAEDLVIGDSEQMVAEISQLAGLNASEPGLGEQ
ncbi:FliM/FliN family flagellar motor C-terminal domain-containing protein [Ruegeria sp. HKCCA6837]|uniref:FliM/FliN family flagellar motor C-terminal domain-containing protein n=1 Tax=Ruegeria sp. HKCCA6837 TaxID=2682989 RepID=UPI001487DB17|nr:FliM/FliN family flagellar motor C-terminal domain-containing protein [Ruegeria sp. HKCCA6837]